MAQRQTAVAACWSARGAELNHFNYPMEAAENSLMTAMKLLFVAGCPPKAIFRALAWVNAAGEYFPRNKHIQLACKMLAANSNMNLRDAELNNTILNASEPELKCKCERLKSLSANSFSTWRDPA